MLPRRSWLWRIVMVCFGICMLSLLSSLVSTGRVLAAGDPITVTSQTDTIAFPKSIDFQMKASDSVSPITQATITLTLGVDSHQELHQVAINPPSPVVVVRWHETMTGDSFVPVGGQIAYSWQLRDSKGNVHSSEQQSLQMVDTRFTWQRLVVGKVEVNWYNRPGDFGQAVFQRANTDLGHIGANLGGGPVRTVHLWIYQTVNDFQGSLPPDAHEWVGGIAFPSLSEASIVVEDMQSDTLNRDMPHELTHLVFHQLIARNIDVPTWFDEGLAVYNQIYHEPMMTLRLKQALAAHNLLRLSEISYDFPADTDKAYLAYAQSWNLVDFMYNTYGRQKMAFLAKDLQNPQSNFSQDLVQALGVDTAHLENQWRIHLNQPPTLTRDQMMTTSQPVQKPVQVQIAADNNAPLLLLLGTLLVLLPLLGIGGLFAYQKRHRAKAARAQRQAVDASLAPYYQYYMSMNRRPPSPPARPQPPPYAMPPSQQAWHPGYAQDQDWQQQRQEWMPPGYVAGREHANKWPDRQVP